MTGAELLTQLEPLHVAAFGWALHCCGGDTGAAEDALQTAYFRVATEKAAFGGRAELKTWWLGVVRMVAREQRRRTWWRLERLRSWFAAGGHLGEETAEPETEENSAITAALAQLPARQREMLHLVFYQDCSVTEAAAAMRVSIGSARQHYDRAKSRLRLLLASHERA